MSKVILAHVGPPCDPPIVNDVVFHRVEGDLWLGETDEATAQYLTRIPTFRRYGGKLEPPSALSTPPSPDGKEDTATGNPPAPEKEDAPSQQVDDGGSTDTGASPDPNPKLPRKKPARSRAVANVLGLSAASLRQGLLRGLLGPGAPHEAFPDAELESALGEVTASVEQELSTRFRLTTFRGHLGPGPAPALPRGEVAEWEGPYSWPSPLPGEGFLRITARVRPVVEVLGAQVVLPGGSAAHLDLPASWFRFDGWVGEIILAPALGAAPLMVAGLPIAFPTLFAGRLPQSLLLTYRAGLGTTGIQRWPKLRRLVLLRTALRILPALALDMNPGLLTSLSADGLSESRASGYATKELEERLSAEAEDLKGSLLDLWEGPALGVL